MISAYASLNINVRRFLDDALGKKWPTEDVGLLLNDAATYLQNETKILKNRTTQSIVAKQQNYVLADNVMEPHEVEYCSGGVWYKVEGVSYDDFRSRKTVVYGSRPKIYTFIDDEGTIALWPVPDTAAETTLLNGSLSAGATSMTTDDTTNFPDQGRVIIDSEVIDYTGKTSTTLTGLTRGVEGTTAAAHNDDSTVTLRDLKINGIRRLLWREMKTYYVTGTVAITINTTALKGTSTAWASNAAKGDLFGITADTTKTDPTRWYEIGTVTDDDDIVLSDTYREATQTTGTYIISSPSPFPAEYDIFLRAYALSGALEKVGDFDGSARQYAKAQAQLKNIKSRAVKVDTELYPKGRHDLRGRFYGAGNLGSHYGGW